MTYKFLEAHQLTRNVSSEILNVQSSSLPIEGLEQKSHILHGTSYIKKVGKHNSISNTTNIKML